MLLCPSIPKTAGEISTRGAQEQALCLYMTCALREEVLWVPIDSNVGEYEDNEPYNTRLDEKD